MFRRPLTRTAPTGVCAYDLAGSPDIMGMGKLAWAMPGVALASRELVTIEN